MKALKIIGIVIAVLVAIVVILGLVAPKDFDVQRTIVINAPEENIWSNVSTFEGFGKWNPWSKKDPNQQITDVGPGGNVGDKHSWKGNKEVGEGSMTVTKAEPNKTLEYELAFADWDTPNTGYMNLDKEGEGTKVTWGMKGSMPFPFNAMALFMNMDKMVGKDFEEGLANLKAYAESAPAAVRYEITEVDWAGKNTLSIRKTVEFKDMHDFFSTNYPKMYDAISKAGGKPGTPLAVYYKYDEEAGNADLAAAIPYEGGKVSSKEYAALNLPAARAYTMDYFGPYNEEMKKPYEAMDAKLKELGADHPEMVIEEYVTDPMTEKDTARWHTKIYFFVKNEQAMK